MMTRKRLFNGGGRERERKEVRRGVFKGTSAQNIEVWEKGR